MRLAKAIYKNLPAYTGLKGRGIKKENWWVINQNKIPAVLVEGGFMDSRIDHPVITSRKGQEGYAKAVAEGLIEFLGLKKSDKPISSEVQVHYKVSTIRDGWLPNVINDEDYAGILGRAIDKIYASSNKVDVYYKVHIIDGNKTRWLPQVKNREDYAGLKGKAVDGFMIKSSQKIKYRVHILSGKWLPWVTGYNEKDGNNGYAGILGKKIDAIQIKPV